MRSDWKKRNPQGRSSDSQTLVASSVLSRAHQAAVVFTIFVVTFAVYSPIRNAGFTNYDDDQYVTSNEHVKAGWSLQTFGWAFTTGEQANWHPLTWISHALDCELFGLDPAWHHASNVLLHAINAALIFILLQYATGCNWPSFMGAALFAVHPINVESVAWISERKNLLSTLFFLLAIAAYGRYVTKPSAFRYVLLGLVFACGLMAKPQVITLPLVLLLLDYWPLYRLDQKRSVALGTETRPAWIASLIPRSFVYLLVEKLPLLILSAISALITLRVQRAGGAFRSETVYGLSARLSNAVVAYSRYVGKALWPSRLAVMYPHPGNTLPRWQVMTSGLLLLAITAVVIWARRRRYLIVGWLWFLGILVPMIGLIQVGDQAIADRYAYISFIGLFVMACWGIDQWVSAKQVPVRYITISAVAILMVLSVLTIRQLYFWHDSIRLWSRAVELSGGRSAVAEDDLAEALVSAGRVEDAMPHFLQATYINPLDALGHLNLGYYAINQGRSSEALDHLLKVVVAQPNPSVLVYARRGLAKVYRRLGDDAHSAENYQAALTLYPDDVESLVGLGLLTQKAGDPALAVGFYKHALSIQPTDVNYLLLAEALVQSGHRLEADEAFRKAQQITQNIDQARRQAASLLSQ